MKYRQAGLLCWSINSLLLTDWNYFWQEAFWLPLAWPCRYNTQLSYPRFLFSTDVLSAGLLHPRQYGNAA